MDYNNNDFEGQNLHIAGEDSPKVSSPLRPYALPKFDFDDSLNGQLRFDSLVENEVFLGITSQEDNHWIDDFSRAGNGIEFNSSASESCALPCRINVWSEATSSESVEMLLKAVVQEETDPGESLIRESNPLIEDATSTKETDISFMKDGINIDSNNGSCSLPPLNVEWTASRPILDTGVVCMFAEDTCGAHGSTLSSCEEHASVKDSDLELLTDSTTIEMKTNNDHGEICAMENKSISNKLNENFSIRDTMIDNSEYSSHNIIPIVGVERDSTGRNCSVRLSKVDSSEEEIGLEMPASVLREASYNYGKGPTVSRNEMSMDAAIDTEDSVGASYGTMIFSSATGAKQVSDTPSVSYENSSIIVAGEDEEVVDIKSGCSGSVTMGGNIELIQACTVKLLVEENNCFSDEVIVFPTNIDDRKDIKEVDGNIKSKNPAINGECFRTKSIMGVEQDLRDVNAMQKSAVSQNHDANLFVDDWRRSSTEEIYSRLVDECQCDSDAHKFNGEDTKLVIDPLDVDEKDVETSSLINDMKDETAIASHSGTYKEYSVLNSEIDDKSLKSSDEAAELHDNTDAKLRSSETENKDLSEKTLSQESKQTRASVAEECLRSDELMSYYESEKVSKHDSVVGETRNNGEIIFYSESSNFSVPNESCNELKKLGLSESGSVALHECVAAEIENKLDEEILRDDKNNISTPVGHSRIENDKIIEANAPNTGVNDISLVEVDKHTSLHGNDVEVDEVLVNSEPTVVDISVDEERDCTLNTGHSMPESTSNFAKDVHCPRIQACKISSASGGNKADDLTSSIVCNISSPTPALGSSSGYLRSSSNRKSRRGSSKPVKGKAKRANEVKKAIPVKQNDKGNKSSQLMSPLDSGQLMNFDCCMKPRGPLLIPASGLPDLNTSAPPSAFFRQPFTDLQQVQLRAQIIVYGCLIQGVAPDESCMISAFAGGRNLWDPSWRACVNRLQVGKSKGIIGEALLPAPPDAQVPDQAQRRTFSEGEVLSSASTHARNKGIASPVVNSVIPLSSPLWTMSSVSGVSHPSTSATKNAVVDYHYQFPAIRNYAAHSGWSPLAPLPWLAPTQGSPFDFSAHHSVFPITTPVKFSPIRDSSMHIGLGSKHFPPVPTTPAGVSTNVFIGPSTDLKNLKFPSEKNSDQTTRKRKKSSDPNDSPVVCVTNPFVDTNPNPVSHQSSKKPLVVEDSGKIPFTPQTQVHSRHTIAIGSHYSTSVAVPKPSLYIPKSSTNQFFTMRQPVVSGDTLKKVELEIESRASNIEGLGNAENAKQQAEQASANAAAATAHCETVWSQLGQQSISYLNLDSESKLASAAAAIAAAALVAKAAAASAMIAANVAAQEKEILEETIIMCQTAKITEYDTSLVSHSINTVTNASPASILSGLKNNPTSAIAAASKAASVASRHKENLDAIVKAAELAAEAMSHAGKIVAMTDPLSLSKMVEAGPNNYWKDLQLEPPPGLKPNDKGSDNCIHEVTKVMSESRNHHGVSDARGASSIKEGSYVEVLRDCWDSKKAWFSATVLGLREGEALVCYSDALSGEVSEQLKEWVSMEAKGNSAPRVRNPHSLFSVPYENTRKRSRDAVRDYSWSVGDKVDVWMQNCWIEGIISEKNKKDESVLSVKFPDQEETVVVKMWHLRPTIIWNGVQWVEASRSGSHNTHKGDTPSQKKPKLLSTVTEITEKGKQLEDNYCAEIRRTEGPALPLSADEKKFSIGSKVDENEHKITRGTRFGSEKEGSRVVLGIPKPGKKRKFMEVSKHYVSEQRGKSNVHSDSVRLGKLLTPHGPSSQRSKNNIKVKTKEKQGNDSKPRGLKSTKEANNLSWKANECDDIPCDHVGKGSVSGNESEAEQEDNSGEAMVFSSKTILPQMNRKKVPSNEHSARPKIPIPNPRGRSVRNEPSTSETAEPRRSVRRIQPTSRLLEGLQSSLIISKLPSTSHEKDRMRRQQQQQQSRGVR